MSAPTRITPQDSSVLALLAQRPDKFDELRSMLSPNALPIGEYLAGKKDVPNDVKETGDAILRWAQERRDRERKERVT